jgi:hypothetical protein
MHLVDRPREGPQLVFLRTFFNKSFTDDAVTNETFFDL